MSDFFISDQEAQQARVDARREARPLGAGTWDEPFENVWERDVPQGVAIAAEGANLFAATIGRSVAGAGRILEGGEFHRPFDFSPLREDQDNWWDRHFMGRAREFAEDRRELATDPATRSWAANQIGGLASTLTAFGAGAAWGGPLGSLTGATSAGFGLGSSAYDRLRTEGLTDQQAFRGGLIEGGFMGAMGVAPVAVPGRLLTRMATGAGINTVFGAGMRGSMNTYLNAIGREDVAEQYQWLDPTAAVTDIVLGAAFGGMFGRRAPARTRIINAETGEPETVELHPIDPQEWFDDARQSAINEDFAEAYAQALIAEDLGHPEAHTLIETLQEDATQQDLDEGRARANEYAQAELGRALPGSPLADAALIQQDAIHREIQTAPGIPADTEARRAHSEALSLAERQAANDEPIDVSASRVDEEEFIPRELPDDFDMEAIWRAELEDSGLDADAAEALIDARLIEKEASSRGMDPDMWASFGPRRRQDDRPMPALRDPLTERVFTGANHGEALDGALAQLADEGATQADIDAMESRLLAEHEKDGGGFSRDGTDYISRDEGLAALGPRDEPLGIPPRNPLLALGLTPARLRNAVRNEAWRASIDEGRETVKAIATRENIGMGSVSRGAKEARQIPVHLRSDLPSLVTRALTELENAPATKGEPTEYAIQSYTRLMDAIRAVKEANGGRMPAVWVDQVAVKTGYAPLAIRSLMSQIRSGQRGTPEMQAAAMELRTTPADRRGSGDRAVIARLMDQGLSPKVVLERLNGLRAEQGREPSTLNSVRQSMWQIKDARRRSYSYTGRHYLSSDGVPFSSVADLTRRAELMFGASWEALSRAGYARVVQSSADVPGGVPRGAKAVHFRDTGESYFIANNIRPSELKGLILHEIGVHHGMEAMLGKRGFNAILRQIDRMFDEEHPIVMEADAWVNRHYPDAKRPEERLAYIIEYHADHSITLSLLARVRLWLVKTFGSSFGLKLTIDDIRALALSSLRRVAEQARREAQPVTEVRPGLDMAASMRRPPAPAFYSAVARVVADSKTARAPGAQWLATISKAPGVKQEELSWIGLPDFLNAAEGPLSREDVLAFVRENGVTVEETVLGEQPGLSAEDQTTLLQSIEEMDRLQSERETLRDAAKSHVHTGTEEGRQSLEATRVRVNTITDRINALDLIIGDLQMKEHQTETSNRTRWPQYTLPGGENYRELLLRLPQKQTQEMLDLAALERQIQAGDFNSLSESEQRAIFERRDRLRYETADDRQAKFKTSHFDQPNILAHVRFTERTDAQGRRTLFLEEVQSDWHQGGRERGYGRPDTTGWTAARAGGSEVWVVRDASGERQGSTHLDNTADEAIAAVALRQQLRAVPDAPFKNNAWAALATKRMVRWAAENDFDSISWTRGQHQIERFNLAQVLGDLEAEARPDGRVLFTPENGRRDARQALQQFGEAEGGSTLMTRAQAIEAFGKDAGARLFDAALIEPRTFMGEDLKIGGEGMRAFYDKILPNIANDLGKKFGARVGETQIPVPPSSKQVSAYRPEDFAVEQRGEEWAVTMDRSRVPGQPLFATRGEAEATLRSILDGYAPVPETVHSLPITPEMRNRVVYDGQPLFSFGGQRSATHDPSAIMDAETADRVTPRSLGMINKMAPERLAAWFSANVETRSTFDGGVSLHFRSEEGLKNTNVRLELRGDGKGGFTGVTVFRGRTSRETTWRAPHRKEVAKALHLFTRLAAVTRHWVETTKPERLAFTGASEAHDRLYVTMMRQLHIEGYEGREVFLRQANVEKNSPTASVMRDVQSRASDPVRTFMLVRSDIAAKESLGETPVETIGAHFREGGVASLRKTQAETILHRREGQIHGRAGQDAGTGRTDAGGDGAGRTDAGGDARGSESEAAAERLKADEAYAKLPPEEQALADNPDMMLSKGTRGEREYPLPARDLFDAAKTEEKVAREMSAGFEAAARCGARYAGQGFARGASFLTLNAGAKASAQVLMGQALGLTTAIPVGILATPMLARNAARLSPENGYLRDVLSDPAQYEHGKGIPISELATDEPDPDMDMSDVVYQDAGVAPGRTPGRGKAPPAPASFKVDE